MAARIYCFRGHFGDDATLQNNFEGWTFKHSTTNTYSHNDITTTGPDRLVVSFVSVAGAQAHDPMTGATGGTWAEAVAEFTTTLSGDHGIGLQYIDKATAGAISGGSDLMSASDAWGVLTVAILPAASGVTHAGASALGAAATVNPVAWALNRAATALAGAAAMAPAASLRHQAAAVLPAAGDQIAVAGGPKFGAATLPATVALAAPAAVSLRGAAALPAAATLAAVAGGALQGAASMLAGSALSVWATPQQIYHGICVPNAPWTMGDLTAFETLVGKQASIVHYFVGYQGANIWDLEIDRLEAIRDAGAVPMISWEWYEPFAGAGLGNTALATVVTGAFDAEIDEWAGKMATYGDDILLRFWWEFNGSWYGWSINGVGGTSAEYIAAWRYVVNRFRAAGANNVQFVWCPNIDDASRPGETVGFMDAYPGDDYVDWMGLDGYNWPSIRSGQWQSFTSLFHDSIVEICTLGQRPLMIAEWGSEEYAGQDKAAWLTAALGTELPSYSRIKATVYFNAIADGADWRIQTSTAAEAAYAAEIADPIYIADWPYPASPPPSGAIKVSAGDDDGYENADGTGRNTLANVVSFGSSVNEGGNGAWVIRGFNIAPGTPVTSAPFEMWFSTLDDPQADLYCFDEDDPASIAAGGIFGRPLTAASVPLVATDMGTSGYIVVADMQAPVQEVVDRPGFSGNVGIVAIGRNNGTGWNAWTHSYDGNPARATQLTINVASGVTHQAEATLPASGAIAAAGGMRMNATSLLPASATVSPTAAKTALAAAVAAGAASFAPAAGLRLQVASALAGAGNMVSAPAARLVSAALLPAAGSLTATTGGRTLADAALMAEASAVAAGRLTARGALAVEATASFVQSGVLRRQAAALLAGDATIANVAHMRLGGAIALPGAAAFAGDAQLRTQAAALLAASGALTGTTGGRILAEAAIAASAEVAAAGGRRMHADTSLLSAAQVLYTARAILRGATAFSAAGELEAQPIGIQVAEAALSGSGTLAGQATLVQQAAAMLVAAATTAAAGGIRRPGAALLLTAASMLSAAGLRLPGAAQLAGTSSTAALAQMLHGAAAELAAAAAIGAAADLESPPATEQGTALLATYALLGAAVTIRVDQVGQALEFRRKQQAREDNRLARELALAGSDAAVQATEDKWAALRPWDGWDPEPRVPDDSLAGDDDAVKRTEAAWDALRPWKGWDPERRVEGEPE